MGQPANRTDLLRRYMLYGSEAAFGQIVERYMKLVYSTCYRELRHRELAEEATQKVFVVLARKAKTIRSDTGLASWLYATARFEASVLRKQEQRRMARDQRLLAEAQYAYNRTEEEAWSSIEPALNSAIAVLPASDREAILLRFFEEKSLREVGIAMGATEDAARMRVTRALEKLRLALINRQSASVSVVVLSSLLTSHAIYDIPSQASASIAQSATSVLPPSSAGRVFRPLNPILGKGLLIMSTTKIVAAIAAALILIAALLFAVAHNHTRLATSSVAWQAPTVPDAGTQQAEQQIKAQLASYSSGFASGDVQKAMAIFSPYLTMNSSNVSNRPAYAITQRALTRLISMGPPSVQITVTSCDVVGNTAAVGFIATGGTAIQPHLADTTPGIYTFVKTNGQWLITSEQI
jgi:RNA polymerase sigma factor (sigma-70 family)